MHLAFGRDIDDKIALYQCLATEPMVLGQRLPTFAEARLDFTDRRQVFRARDYRVLGEFADRADHPAATAESAAAAYRIDIDADAPGGIEQRLAVRERAATSRRQENDFCVSAGQCSQALRRRRLRPPRPRPSPSADGSRYLRIQLAQSGS